MANEIFAKVTAKVEQTAERTILLRPPRPYLIMIKTKDVSAARDDTGEMTRKERRSTELTKSSNPSRVPLNSRSFFMMTQIFDPMHLSMSSGSRQISDNFGDEREGRGGPVCRCT